MKVGLKSSLRPFLHRALHIFYNIFIYWVKFYTRLQECVGHCQQYVQNLIVQAVQYQRKNTPKLLNRNVWIPFRRVYM